MIILIVSTPLHTGRGWGWALFLSVHCLTSSDSYQVVDVLYRATTAQVVDRTSDTLKDRTDSSSTSETLNQLIGDVSYLEAWHNQYVGLTCNL